MSKITLAPMDISMSSTTKFDSLTFSKNGFILKYRNKPEIEIPFAEFDKIYIKKKKISSGIIVLSAVNELDMRIKALDAGADDFLTKQVEFTVLKEKLKKTVITQ